MCTSNWDLPCASTGCNADMLAALDVSNVVFFPPKSDRPVICMAKEPNRMNKNDLVAERGWLRVSEREELCACADSMHGL